MNLSESSESSDRVERLKIYQKLFDLVKKDQCLKSKDADGYNYTIARHFDTSIVTVSIVRDCRAGEPTPGYDFNINPFSEIYYLDPNGEQSRVSDKWLKKIDIQADKLIQQSELQKKIQQQLEEVLYK